MGEHRKPISEYIHLCNIYLRMTSNTLEWMCVPDDQPAGENWPFSAFSESALLIYCFLLFLLLHWCALRSSFHDLFGQIAGNQTIHIHLGKLRFESYKRIKFNSAGIFFSLQFYKWVSTFCFCDHRKRVFFSLVSISVGTFNFGNEWKNKTKNTHRPKQIYTKNSLNGFH